MVQNNNDHALIARVKAGDKAAFNVLVVKYEGRLRKVVQQIILDPTESMDVTQDVFIKAYRAIGHFREESTFYTWLYRIAINTAKSYIQHSERRWLMMPHISEASELVQNTHMEECGTPEHLLLRDEIEDIIFKTFDALPNELRYTIVLRELEGFSYEEIADALDCPVGTVRSRIFRAREAIDKALGE